jgi:hypothetical protein
VGCTGDQPPTAKVSMSKATDENAKMTNLRFVLTHRTTKRPQPPVKILRVLYFYNKARRVIV